MQERATRPGVASVAVALACLAASCQKDPQGPRWDVDVAVPLVRTTLTLGDLVADSLLTADADGNATLVYDAQLFALALDTVLATPDTSFHYVYKNTFPNPITIFPGATLTSSNNITRFDLDQLALRDLRIRSGHVSLELVNRISNSIEGHFELPEGRNNGQPLQLNVTVGPGSAGSPTHLSTQQDMAGYDLDMRGPAYDDVNTLTTELSYVSDPGGEAAQMSAADSLEAIVSYADIVPAYARGYFGQRLIHIDPDTTTLDLFQDISGMLDIDQATARLDVRNGIGVDARAQIAYISGVNTRTGTVVPLHHAITSSPLNLDRAVDHGTSFTAALNSYTLTTVNSNIDLFLENLPDRLAYALDVTIDPLGDVSNGNDFLYYESKLSGQLHVEVPLRIIATDLTLSKTTTVDLPGTSDGHAIQSGTLHLFTTNGFPFTAALSMHIVDAGGHVLADLGPGGTVLPAQVNGNGVVLATTSSQTDFSVSREQVDLLHQGGRLRIDASFNTVPPGQHVQLRTDYTLEAAVSFEGSYIVNGDD